MIESAAPATVTVYKPFSAGSFQIDRGEVCSGDTPARILNVSDHEGGSGTYTYTWFLSNTGGTNTDLHNNSSTYQPKAGEFTELVHATYTCTVTDALCGTQPAGAPYALSIGTHPTTSLYPVSFKVCNGAPIQITAGTYSGGKYEWRLSTNGTDFSVVSGQATAVLTLPPLRRAPTTIR